MPKPHSFPTLYNEALQLSISKLKEWDYLSPHQIKSGMINWSTNGNHTGSISIIVNTQSARPFIELDYNFRDEPCNYKVYLTSMPSNLGNGEIWYFICPHTQKRCRKLYSISGYFYHRDAFVGCMYESQTYSKHTRELLRSVGAYFGQDKLYEELTKKHFKRIYAGKPTKRYLRLVEQIERAENIPFHEVERAMIS